MSEGNPWGDYEPCSFEAEGYGKIRVMLKSLVQAGGQRLVARARPFRPGVKYDTTGPTDDTYEVEMLFTNDLEEPGVTDDGGAPMWPDRLEDILKMLKSGLTMTFNSPFERGLRVKCHPWRRSANAEDNRGGELLTCTLLSDNEDNVDREALVRPSVRSGMSRRVEEAQFEAESQGVWDGSLADLTRFTSDLIATANSPGQAMSQVAAAGATVARCIEMVRQNFSSGGDGHDQFSEPESFLLRMQLLEVDEQSSRAEEEARESKPKTRYHYPTRTTTIWKIAASLKQSSQLLIDLNGDEIEDFSYIKKDTPVRVLVQ